ncbi:MAG: hypothetical protein DRH03_01865 [Deltaproteobacteria bacterium]|nr:MAG: hypothetical protein DRH03_01865 [Deltaproteobacteria bacterium]
MQTSEQERSEPKKEQSRHLLTALHLVKNLGADMFRHYRWRVIAIIIADGLVMVCTLLSLTGIFLVFKAYIRKKPLELHSFSLSLTSTSLMYTVIGLIGVGLLAVWIEYIKERSIVDLTVDFQRRMLREIMTPMVLRPDDEWLLRFDSPLKKNLAKIFGVFIRRRSMLCKNLLESVLASGFFVFALIAMVKVDWFMSLIVVPFIVLFAYPFALISSGASRIQSNLDITSNDSRKIFNDSFDHLFNCCNNLEERRIYLDSVIQNRELFEPRRLFLERSLQNQKMHALNSTFFFIMIMIFTIQQFIRQGQADWSHLLVFLVAFRFCVKGFHKIAGTVMSFSRFYEYLREYEALRNHFRQTEFGFKPILMMAKNKSIPFYSEISGDKLCCSLKKGSLVAVVTVAGTDLIGCRQSLAHLIKFCPSRPDPTDVVFIYQPETGNETQVWDFSTRFSAAADRIVVIAAGGKFSRKQFKQIIELVKQSLSFGVLVIDRRFFKKFGDLLESEEIPLLLSSDEQLTLIESIEQFHKAVGAVVEDEIEEEDDEI